MDVVLLDRADKHYIVLHYDRDGQQLNYLQRQASFLRLRDGARDSTSEADLVALLSGLRAPRPESDRTTAGGQANHHVSRLSQRSSSAQRFALDLSRAISEAPTRRSRPNNCRLATWRLVNGSSIAPGSEPATDSRLTRPEVSELRAIPVNCGRGPACSSRRRRALLGHHGGRSCRAVLAHHAPHGSVLQHKDLGDLSPADRLWLIKVVQSLHNGFKNAMMVSTSSNQWHIRLTLLFAMGSPCTTSAPTQPPRSFDLSNRASLALRSTATGPAR